MRGGGEHPGRVHEGVESTDQPWMGDYGKEGIWGGVVGVGSGGAQQKIGVPLEVKAWDDGTPTWAEGCMETARGT